MRVRLLLGAAGILLGLFGVFRLLTQVPSGDLVALAEWLVGALVLHDAVLSPLIVGVGWLLARTVRPRARRWVQGALIAGGVVTVIAMPLIHRQGTQPASKAILRRDYGTNLLGLLAVVAGVALVGYLIDTMRGRSGRGVNTVNRRPSAAQDSPAE